MHGKLLEIAQLDKPPKMQMLFFANTFPLAYHYGLALQAAGKNHGEFIQLGTWKQNEDDDGIYYTSQDEAPRDGARTSLPVTIFQPKWAFIPLTLGTSKIWRGIPPDPDSDDSMPCRPRQLIDFLVEAAKAGYRQIAIYAELRELGDHLKKMIGEKWPSDAALFPEPVPIVYAPQQSSVHSNLPLFAAADAGRDVLRVFIHGGSLSSYLLRKSDRYLPLTLRHDARIEHLRTSVCCGEDYVSNLGDYHRALYRAANEPRTNSECPPFFTVYRAYNEISRLIQHRTSFTDASEFGKCLKDHHEDPEGLTGIPHSPNS